MNPHSDPFQDFAAAMNASHPEAAQGHYADGSSSGRIEHPWQRDAGAYAEAGEIGNGAYATVLRGRNRNTGADVALKKITLHINEEGVPQSVIREVSLLKRFERYSHLNIVKLLDVCHGLSGDGRRLYINLVFEFCPQDLAMFLESAAQKAVPLAESTIRRMIGNILSGVKFLHDQLVVHRDLKPQNVLIAADGQLKIADYGLARMYSLQTAMTTVVVTLWYRSPELLLQCNYGFAVDVWSIGCMLAEMYRLRPLFPGASEAEQLAKILQIIGLPPAELWPRDSVVDRRSFQGMPGYSSLRDKVPMASMLAFDIIRKILFFCPDDRPTVSDLLEHPYFIEPAPAVVTHSSSSSSSSGSDDSVF